MANEHQIVIEGHIVKELRCKNDECRALIGYDNILLGVFIHNCPKCGTTSVFKMQYKALAREFIKKLQTEFESKNQTMKGGE